MATVITREQVDAQVDSIMSTLDYLQTERDAYPYGVCGNVDARSLEEIHASIDAYQIKLADTWAQYALVDE